MNSSRVELTYAPGATPDHISAVDSYVAKLVERGLPAILSPEHFSLLTGIKTERLYAMSNGPAAFYRKFFLKKRSGGLREISAPLPLLLVAQRWILSEILENVPVHAAAKAYIKGGSIKKNARLHRGQLLLFKTDVKEFFPSISEYRIIRIFMDLGYLKSVATFLAKLCCLDGALPQGAATSGRLSNIVMREFDECLLQFCRGRGLRYSRYADDIAISGQSVDVDVIKDVIVSELKKIGLTIHGGKTKIRKPHVRQEVTGVVVNEKLSVGRIYLRKLRQEFYYVEKFGIYGHARAIGEENPRYALERLIGKFSHAIHINSKQNDLKDCKKRLLEVRSEQFGY